MYDDQEQWKAQNMTLKSSYLISLNHQQAYKDSRMGRVDYYKVCIINISILAMQALFVMEFSPYTVKIT